MASLPLTTIQPSTVSTSGTVAQLVTRNHANSGVNGSQTLNHETSSDANQNQTGDMMPSGYYYPLSVATHTDHVSSTDQTNYPSYSVENINRVQSTEQNYPVWTEGNTIFESAEENDQASEECARNEAHQDQTGLDTGAFSQPQMSTSLNLTFATSGYPGYWYPQY
jgi:hypothetical protein